MTLVVYADTLIVISFLYILSGLILFGLIYNYRIRLPSIIVSAMTGALLSTYIFILFIKSKAPAFIYLPFLIALLTVSLGIAFKFESRKVFFKSLVSLFFISLAEAGVAVFLLSIIAYRVRNWIVLYIVMIIFVELIMMIVIFRQSRVIKMHRQSVQLKIIGTEAELIRGLADTGNILRDPIYSRPVVILSIEYANVLDKVLDEKFEINCHTVNGSSVLHGGIVKEMMLINRKNERVYYNVPIAFSSMGFAKDGFGAIIPIDYAGGL